MPRCAPSAIAERRSPRRAASRRRRSPAPTARSSPWSSSPKGRKQAAILDAEGDAQAIALRANADKTRLQLLGEGEGAAALARLTGIKEAQTDKNVLTVEYLAALERIGDGRATKLVIPAEFSGLLGTVAALAEATAG